MNGKKTDLPIRINCARRAIIVQNQASACLMTGTDKLNSGYGNGDCTLLDFKNHFFAVSDSSDRWPTASRNFLSRLTRGLDKAPSPPQKKDDWLALTNAAYARQEYIHRATFSGVAISRKNGNMVATIIHGGDSLVLIVDIKTKQVKFQTDANMNFVGRIKSLSEVINIPLENDNERIIMASDGLADVARIAKYPLEEMCLTSASKYPVNEVPEQLNQFFKRQDLSMQHDDIAVIAINPFQVEDNKKIRLLMGGTTAIEEKRYWAELRDEKIPDEWLSPEKLNSSRHSEAVKAAKITSF